MKFCHKAIATIAFVAATGPVLAATITFDDLIVAPDGNTIVNGYAGFDWANFSVLNGGNYANGQTGYTTGVVSPGNIAFNAYANAAGFSSTSEFSLNSLYVTKAWYDGLTRFQGYVGNVLTYSLDVYSTTTGPTFVTFDNWNKLNKVVMSDGNGSWQSVVDNITVSAVPEPETYAMLLGGLGLLGAMSRRKRQN